MSPRLGPRPAELIRRTAASFEALYRAAHPDGLALGEWTFLSAVAKYGPCTAPALASLIGVSRTSAHAMAARVIAGDFVTSGKTKIPSPGPNPVLLSLSAKGRRALAKAETPMWNAEVKLMSRLSPEERATFLNALSITAYAGVYLENQP